LEKESVHPYAKNCESSGDTMNTIAEGCNI